MVPGMMMAICFSTIATLTAMAIVLEQTQGLIDRTLNTGKFGHLSAWLSYIFLFTLQQVQRWPKFY